MLEDADAVFKQIRARQLAAELQQRSAEQAAQRRRRSESLDQSVINEAWVRIFDWRANDWFYFNAYVAAVRCCC